MSIEISLAYSDLETIKVLFQEYSTMLKVDLEFQDYEKELKNLPGKYALPEGRLYLANYNGEAAGCIALRKLKNGYCEIKRLYVRPNYRGHKLGEYLMQIVIAEAEKLGYKKIYLDTLISLKSAVKLYRKMDFYEIPAYYNNPLENVLYFCKDIL